MDPTPARRALLALTVAVPASSSVASCSGAEQPPAGCVERDATASGSPGAGEQQTEQTGQCAPPERSAQRRRCTDTVPLGRATRRVPPHHDGASLICLEQARALRSSAPAVDASTDVREVRLAEPTTRCDQRTSRRRFRLLPREALPREVTPDGGERFTSRRVVPTASLICDFRSQRSLAQGPPLRRAALLATPRLPLPPRSASRQAGEAGLPVPPPPSV